MSTFLGVHFSGAFSIEKGNNGTHYYHLMQLEPRCCVVTGQLHPPG